MSQKNNKYSLNKFVEKEMWLWDDVCVWIRMDGWTIFLQSVMDLLGKLFGAMSSVTFWHFACVSLNEWMNIFLNIFMDPE